MHWLRRGAIVRKPEHAESLRVPLTEPGVVTQVDQIRISASNDLSFVSAHLRALHGDQPRAPLTDRSERHCADLLQPERLCLLAQISGDALPEFRIVR